MATKKNICRICLENINNESFSIEDIDPESKLEIKNILTDLNYKFPDEEDCMANKFCYNCTLKLFGYYKIRDEYCSIFLLKQCLENECKICESKEQLKSFRDSITFEEQCTTFLEMFTKLISYELRNEQLTQSLSSSSICEECYSKLVDFYSFHMECFKAVEFWTDYIMEHYAIPKDLTLSLHFKYQLFNGCKVGKLIAKHLFKCKLCSKQFRTKLRLQIHIKKHCKRPFRCKLCPKKFKQSALLKCHLKYHHKMKKDELEKNLTSNNHRIKCDKCNKSFSGENNLRIHSKRIHSAEKLFKCTTCSKSFSDSVDLRRHLRLHSSIRPYKCETCPKSFRQSSTLKEHMRVHSSDKPYKCTICTSSFKAPQVLKKHLQRHNKENYL